MRTGKRQHEAGFTLSEAGFTLLELMIVMTIILILTAIAVPAYQASVRAAREAVLKEDLQTMRAAIDSYTADKEKAPQTLDDLVQDGYLREIPEDPMTHSRETWSTETGDALHSLDQTDPGIDNVHSGSQDTGTDGQQYSAW
jgi:general secretion pathway protein G